MLSRTRERFPVDVPAVLRALRSTAGIAFHWPALALFGGSISVYAGRRPASGR